MNLRLALLLSGCALSVTLALPGDARACGGCFVPPVVQQAGSTVVTGHRMALSISPAQTVLWDQIQYAGDPAEFAWVLPVKPGAVLELSTDAWFETLDAATTVSVSSPRITCPSLAGSVPAESDSGCGASKSSFGGGITPNAVGDSGGQGADDPVTVVHHGTVGPYETVTLTTDTPGALNQWLTDSGYTIDPSSQPVIDAYVAEGFDFIALRLQPGKDVRAMKPVRVNSPGASTTLPLRMVAIGTGAQVAINLFVISEGRMAAKNFANTITPIDLLSWDFGTASSNYAELRKTLLSQNQGRAWMTSYARQGSLLSPVFKESGGVVQYVTDNPSFTTTTIVAAYLQQGVNNGEATDASCLNALLGVANNQGLVVDPCGPGVPSDDPSCGMVSPGEIDARDLECGAPGQMLDDLAVALTGLHPADVWLTRLEANLPQAGLKTDLEVKPAAQQEVVDNFLQARIVLNLDAACPGAAPVVLGPDAAPPRGRAGELPMYFAAAALVLAFTRRLARPAFRISRIGVD